MIIAWLTAKFGPQFAKPILYGVIVLFVAIGAFTVAKCTGRKDVSQVEQTTRSGDAIANAAANAVDVLSNRVVTDQAVDAATDNAMKEIGNAQSPTDVRSTVLSVVCAQANHRSDPACAVR